MSVTAFDTEDPGVQDSASLPRTLEFKSFAPGQSAGISPCFVTMSMMPHLPGSSLITGGMGQEAASSTPRSSTPRSSMSRAVTAAVSLALGTGLM